MNSEQHKGPSSFNSYQWVFYLLFIYSYLNIGVLVTRIFKQSIPINIVIFVVAFGFIILRAPYKFYPKYSFWVYIFLFLFVLGGYIGPSADYGYQSIQSIFKHWIVHLGLPWLALISVEKQHFRFYLKTILILGAAGGVFSLIQIPFFSVFQIIIGSSTVRTAGFWFNPNNAAMMLLATLFLTGSFSSSKKILVLILRVLIIVGIITSFSRTAIVLLFLGGVYYAFVMKRTKLIILTCVGGVVFSIGLAINMSKFSEHQQKRITSLVQIASNDEVDADNRSALWIYASVAVLERGPIFGLGHTSMDHIVPLAARGLGPHNYFIWIWGNSGLMGLLGLFIYLIAMYIIAKGIRVRNIKAGALIIVITIGGYDILAHDIMSHQMTGTLTAMLILSIYHFREKNHLLEKKVKLK